MEILELLENSQIAWVRLSHHCPCTCDFQNSDFLA